MNIEITSEQKWIIAQALLVFTSEESEARLLVEFPNIDLTALASDIEDLVRKLKATT